MYLYKHKTEWAQEYNRARNAIISSYGSGLELHHIGSTAIEGLKAKDCIDILGVVPSIAIISDKKERLIELGYEYRGAYGIQGREYFSKKHRKIHLHIFQSGDFNIIKHLNFVNVMRANPRLIDELNVIKQQLHTKFPNDREAYQIGKKYFYDKINQAIL
jgi:GrpB-like predicted nucleotidyltransferase (UPF0157 family)